MRIERKEQDQKLKAAAKQALDTVSSAASQTGRPCGSDCHRECDKCGSTSCTCMCSRDCRFISKTLTSDPEHFPLEERIAPLVFEINKLGIFTPNWSCEGHVGLDGKIWKIPRVWFYAESVLHVRLLADSLSKMSIEKKLKCPWQVVLTFTDNDNLEGSQHEFDTVEESCHGQGIMVQLFGKRGDQSLCPAAVGGLSRQEP